MAHAGRINRLFGDVDVLVTPTTGKPPVGAAEWEGMSAARTLVGMADAYPYTGIWNHTGQPSCSVPAPSLSDKGLPLGVQLVGPPDSETTRCPWPRSSRPTWAGPAAGRAWPSFSPVREVRLHDTLTGQLRPIEPRDPPRVGIYACGPTVYARLHIGNARPYVVFALLRRFLEHEGYDPTLVVNVTDVNDKIYDAAREQGVSSEELARAMTAAYVEDTDRLGLGRPDSEPKASATIGAIVALIEDLIESGHAYEAGGDVYFSVESFPEYGKLSNRPARGDAAGRGRRRRRAQAGAAGFRALEGGQGGRGHALELALG